MIHPAVLRKQKMVVSAFILLIVLTMILAMGIGSSAVSFHALIPTLLGRGNFYDEFLLFGIRLPRMMVTLLAGMALAVSGAVLQSITKNDIADPGIMGINSGAGVAIAVFYLFFPLDAGTFTYEVPVVAFVGALITACLIHVFAYQPRVGLEPVRLILVGFGFSIALSGLMVMLISSAGPEKADFIAKWLAGEIWGTSWPFVWAILPWLVVLIPFTMYKANRLNLFGLHDAVSIGLGLHLRRERAILLLTAVALAASAVSVTGGIAFVGLLAPHLAKSLIGPRSQLFMPIALLMGGWLLLVSDVVGHNLELPAGVMVALIGAPYFLFLLTRKR
ncbi:iron ABC transporter permease [Alicyclobacillus contaminans]|uniref:FecCD family ABC transporter permease n=1 Tax=Alicyclobacillus contaminans TaxID=392016 RepID=UPI000408114C|nr:iron ABC transporter permease [Alicyclobacillus contaminans]GMA52252.1 iron ABC transporter permease [Alicyclobacillus contaminans]